MSRCWVPAFVAVAFVLSISPVSAQEGAAHLPRDYHVKPVTFNHVEVQDRFWTPRLEASRSVTIPYAFQQCSETGRIRNFEKAAGREEGDFEGTRFDDSDVYKIMEGASYSLWGHEDDQLREYLEGLVEVMAEAQWEDGYLFTFYSLPERRPDERWTNVESNHELYCMGHMYEAAVAHHQETGTKRFLDVATKNADLVCRVFNPDGRTDPPGHQEIEIALCKLYRATGNEKYLDQAKFFLDQRGHEGNRGPKGEGDLYGTYSQDDIPVVEQTEAVGHSVRAAYLYTGMADVAALTGDMEYVNAIDRIWEDVVNTKLYVTGGIGATGGHEGFGGPYELPNHTAYCETCASIANVLWNHRMFLMRGDAKYIDVLERTMYNAALSGVSIEGNRFFYPNVLASVAGRERSAWFGCACCPSNVARFIPSIPGFAYAYAGDDIYVNLYLSGKAVIDTGTHEVKLATATNYPWTGAIKIRIYSDAAAPYAFLLRIPGWAREQPVPSDLYSFAREMSEEISANVNGTPVPLDLDKGYLRIERHWKKGDLIELNVPMPVRRVVSHGNVAANKDRIALQRGPIVFCLEGEDNSGQVFDLFIPDDADLNAQYEPELVGGVATLFGEAQTAKRTLDGKIVADSPRTFKAIPYYAWAHRGRTPMTVWPARVLEAARPKPAETLTYRSKASASFVHVSLDAIKDQIEPANSGDSSTLQLDFWPHKDQTEWVQFEWEKEHTLSSVQVYWFDDTGRGECRVPKAWRVLYRDAKGEFQPVVTDGDYGIAADQFNRVLFEPVSTSAIKLEIDLQQEWSAGIQEVVIE